MENNLKLNEAFDFAKKNKSVTRGEVAKMLWPNADKRGATVNLSNLVNGKSKKIDIAAVPIICRTLGVSADFLFGLSVSPTEFVEGRPSGVERLSELELKMTDIMLEMRKIIQSF